jgi:UDP-GlcNAc:undecaprenyl-phosphate GlcNAc-1-phosphate transferase
VADSLSIALSRYATIAAVVFGVSALATWLTRRVALSRGWVERPRADRWHSRPTARFGGAGMLAGLAFGLALFVPFTPQLLGLALLGLLMFLFGLLDDLQGLRPQTKLVVQLAAGVLLYVAGFRFNAALPWAVDFFVVLFWVVAITNAMNLLDNMDGLAAGVAIIAGVFRFLFYLTDGNEAGALLTTVFIGAVAGFLVFNFSPASIFMGDCGSFLIGFVLAALNLTTSQMYAKNLVAVLLFPALVLAIPIFDTAFVSVVRWLSGRRLSQGGADHTSHRLVAVGLTERQAVLVLYTLSAASGAVAYSLYRVGFSYAWFGAAMCVLGLLLFGIYLSSVAVYPEGAVPADAGTARFTLSTQFQYKRAILWVLIDLVALVMAYYLGFLLRYGHTPDWSDQLALFIRSAPFAVATLLVSVSAFGLYRTDWQTFSLHEVKAIVAGVTIGTLLHGLVLVVGFGLGTSGLLVLIVVWGAAVLALTGSRGVIRALSDSLRPDRARGARALIYGAGAGGELALRELRTNSELGLLVVGFIDDDPTRRHTLIHGVPVLGGAADLERIAGGERIDAVVVSTRKLAPERLAELLNVASRLDLGVCRLSVDVQPLGADSERDESPALVRG